MVCFFGEKRESRDTARHKFTKALKPLLPRQKRIQKWKARRVYSSCHDGFSLGDPTLSLPTCLMYALHNLRNALFEEGGFQGKNTSKKSSFLFSACSSSIHEQFRKQSLFEKLYCKPFSEVHVEEAKCMLVHIKQMKRSYAMR